MSNFGDHPAGFFGVSGFYNGVATQSARFDYSSSPTLYKTPSASSLTTWSWSAWFKLASTANTQFNIFSADSSSTNYQNLALNPNTHGALSWVNRPAGGQNQQLITNQLFRDTSAWYHLVVVWDTTNSTEADRSRMYLNGSRITSFATNTQPSQNTESIVNTNIRHNVGSAYAVHGNNVNGFNGYLAEINFVDGLALDSSYFGETKNGVWIAKTPVVSNYGQNGYRLQMKQVGVGTAGTGTIGADTSGKGNHYTSGGITADDCNMPDSPENNFATWNFNDLNHRAELVEANCKLQATTYSTSGAGGGNFGFATGTISLPSSGKFYVEALHRKHAGTGNISSLGVMNRNQADTTGNVGAYFQADNTGGEGFDGIQVSTGSGDSSYFLSRNDGNEEYRTTQTDQTNLITALAIDIDNGYIYIGYNNGTDNTGSEITWRDFASNDTGSSNVNPTSAGSGTGGIARTFSLNDVIVSDVATNGGNSNKSSVTINFGQDSSFAGVTTSQGETDANGKGDFYYTVPSGYLALCSANLPDTAIGPNSDTQASDYFNTVTYTGNGANSSATQDISGVGFKPDWLWIKRRDSAAAHNLRDSTRGALKHLQSDGSGAEDTESDAGVTAFLDDGFRLKGTNAGTGQVNANNATYVAWNWKANGGTTSTNNDGSITSTVQANTTAGFSVVTWSGNETNGATIGHGLSSAPKLIITKGRSHATSWIFGVGPITGSVNNYFTLNTDSAIGNLTNFYQSYTSDSNTTFTVGVSSADEMNRNTGGTARTYVSYCFTEIEGYSKMGSYIGNGFNAGTFIHTGFRPAFILVKSTSSSRNWPMYDSVRDVDNPVGAYIAANLSDQEFNSALTYAPYDFVSNGFKLVRGNTDVNSTVSADVNASGQTYIYMAFAEVPFKYANAR